jgi:hypothetical protein
VVLAEGEGTVLGTVGHAAFWVLVTCVGLLVLVSLVVTLDSVAMAVRCVAADLREKLKKSLAKSEK